MNRRHFLGALAAAVVAPWLPKLKAESSHSFHGKGTATSTGLCAVCDGPVTSHETITLPRQRVPLVSNVVYGSPDGPTSPRDLYGIPYFQTSPRLGEYLGLRRELEEVGKEYVYFANGERHVWRRILRAV